MKIEKIQGITFDAIALGPMKHASRKNIPRAALYVALSRVRTLNGLYLMEPLTLGDIKPPSQEILLEIETLKSLGKYK